MNITKAIADHIAKKAINGRFTKEIVLFLNTEDTFAMRCYARVFPQSERDAAFLLSDNWLLLSNRLTFNINGWNATLHLLKSVPVPHRGYFGETLGSITGDLADDIQSFVTSRDERIVYRLKIERHLSANIYAVRTIKRLAESWPEGKEFYAEETALDAKPKMSVAVPFSEINETLGLAAI